METARRQPLYDVRDLNDQETTNHAAAQPAVVADLVAERTMIANSLAAETSTLGEFTSCGVLISEGGPHTMIAGMIFETTRVSLT